MTNSVKASLRELRSQLWQLNHRISEHASMRDVDLDCLDLVARHGPLSPGEVARQAGLHPATVTGVLDRLERAGWVVRERHRTDRRAVVVRVVSERGRELIHLYAGMNTAMDRVCGRYTAAELELIIDFLTRATEAGRIATEKLV